MSTRRDPSSTVGLEAGGRGEGQVRRLAVRGMVAMGLSTAGRAVLQLATLGFLARFLTPSEFGLASGALIAVMLATALAESGIGAAIVQRSHVTHQHMRVAWTLSVSFGAAAWLAVAALAPAIESLLRLPGLAPLLRLLSLVFLINSLTLSDFLLSRRLQFGRLAGAEVSAYAFGYATVAITLAALGYGPWSIVWAQVAQSTVRMVLVTAMAPYFVWPSLARGPMKELLSFGVGLTLGRVAQWAAAQMDNLVVGRFLGAAALGLYGRAYQLVQIPANLLGQVANEVLFPAMAAVQNEHEKLHRIFRLGVGFLAAFALPVSVLAAITSKPLVLVLLGPDWLPLRAAFDVIIFGLLFRTSVKFTDALMKARGAIYRRAWRNVVFAALVFVGAYLGQRSGIHGVAIGVLVALSLNYVMTNALCLQLVGMSWRSFLTAHVPAAILSVAAGLPALAVQLAVQSHGLADGLQLGASWAVGLLSCVLLLRSAPRLRFLREVSSLTLASFAFLPGPLAKPVGRVLGPGYAANASVGGAGESAGGSNS